MSVISSNTKLYQIYFNRKVSEYIKNNIDGDVSEYISELKEKENLLNTINKDILYLCELLRKFNGKLYGGIVRNFFLRKEDTNDIDIWFTDNDKMYKFMKELEHCWEGYFVESKLDSEKCPFDKKTYIITSPLTGLKYSLDLILSDNFPVDDFDVNYLMFDGKKFEMGKSYGKYVCLSIQLVLENISKKEMVQLPTFKNTQLDKIRESKLKETGWFLKNNDIGIQNLGFFTFDRVYNSVINKTNV